MTKLTIGLPVYNGGKTLARSLDRLLRQTMADFTLVINDNASTDDTGAIAAAYAARDPRVRVFRNASNVSWYENFRRTLARADTPYFMWATHDDLWEPRFAEANIAALERHPEAVCSVPKIVYFDSGGAERIAPDTGPLTGTPACRLKRFFDTMYSCGRLYGLYRTEVLRRSWPAGLDIPSNDWLVVALTLVEGDHIELDEVLLRREAQPPGYYARNFARVFRFTPSWRDWVQPLHRFNGELKHRLDPELYRQIRPALWRLNAAQSAVMFFSTFPFLKPPLRAARRIMKPQFGR
jgi:glycosyltransferase involved in cell wall biosynthesis